MEHEAIIQSGFKQVSKCNCGGTLKITYQLRFNKTVYELSVRPYRDFFLLRISGLQADKGKINELQQTLEKHEII